MLRRALLLILCFVAAPVHAGIADRTPSQLLLEELGKPLGISPAEIEPMPVLANDMVKHFEEWIPHAYNDPVGYCTIGYGHLISRKKCEQIQLGVYAKPLSMEQGSSLLDSDTIGARWAVSELVTVSLTKEQYGALSSFVFNVGKTNFAKSTLLKLVNQKDFDNAGPEFRRWIKARGQVLNGLVARRSCEEALFVGRLKYGPKGTFDRKHCKSLGAAPEVGDLINIETGE